MYGCGGYYMTSTLFSGKRLNLPSFIKCLQKNMGPCLTRANEKYTGNVLLQKTFVEDLFSRKQIKNRGELEKFLIHEHHPAIISRELFETVNQAENILNG